MRGRLACRERQPGRARTEGVGAPHDARTPTGDRSRCSRREARARWSVSRDHLGRRHGSALSWGTTTRAGRTRSRAVAACPVLQAALASTMARGWGSSRPAGALFAPGGPGPTAVAPRSRRRDRQGPSGGRGAHAEAAIGTCRRDSRGLSPGVPELATRHPGACHPARPRVSPHMPRWPRGKTGPPAWVDGAGRATVTVRTRGQVDLHEPPAWAAHVSALDRPRDLARRGTWVDSSTHGSGWAMPWEPRSHVPTVASWCHERSLVVPRADPRGATSGASWCHAGRSVVPGQRAIQSP